MKTLLRTLPALVLACLLQQCSDPGITDPNRAFEDSQITAQAKKEPFTLSAIISETLSSPPNQFLAYLWGTTGEITVDWGDNTTSHYQMDGSGFDLQKIYASPGNYIITISGDLRNITNFQSSYGEGVFDSINLSSLTGLAGIRVGLTSGPHTFDFTNNRNLTELSLTSIEELTQIVLPKRHAISMVSIAGPNNLAGQMVDYVINNVYENAVKQKIYNGYFNVMELYYEDPEFVKNLVGPPSSESVAQLRILQDVYGWMIVPVIE